MPHILGMDGETLEIQGVHSSTLYLQCVFNVGVASIRVPPLDGGKPCHLIH